MAGIEVAGAAHCGVARCHQLDFLPFTCNACKGVYCKDHFAYASHSCTSADKSSVQVILCPICSESIRITASEDPNATWERHFEQSCRQAPKVKQGPKRCPVQGCKEQLGPSNRIECKRCGTTVCLKHRAQEDHPCLEAKAEAKAAPAASRTRSAPPQAQRPAPTGVSDDERLAWEMQQQELAQAERRNPGQKKKKKSITDRAMSMFACFKASAQRRPLLGGSSSSSTGR
eukprot:TRINITY_DN63124_c0_g1_i1.p1 TRINITY_DN63124_c0_g1~~TRINITY_DN63124_c0_g1_i1.p1  ORF type:complete len:252 (+),score=35.39 TRINITY_DN63124_c0_g1_i1:67-756(+)